MTEYLDDQLLKEFAHTFYGYGNYNGRYWFVGMEEGGGSREEVAKKLEVWAMRGKRELEDLKEYRNEVGKEVEIPCRFGKEAKIQPTWKGLIRILLSSEDQNRDALDDKEQVRKYQKESLGGFRGCHCLVELLPLPSPSTKKWYYSRHSNIPCMSSREQYKKEYLPLRIKHLRQRINKYEPKVVIFYGKTYWDHWKSIASVDFRKKEYSEKDAYFGHNGTSLFVITLHPMAKGVTSEYFHQVGKAIARELKR